VHDGGWIASHLPAGVTMCEVTGAIATLNMCGPKARDVLASVTDDDVSNEALPFLAAQEIGVGLARVLAVRIGYVGELGYELYIPQDYAAHVYETLWAAGEEFGIADAGYRAIESCRLEKGYLYWSGDISPDYNPYEAGLGFAVKLDKGEFVGREALARIKAEGVKRRLTAFRVDGFAPFHGGEAILHQGKVISVTTSAGYGHHLGSTIAFGYLPAGLSGTDGFEIEAFGTAYKATRGPRCLYDAEMKRLKG